MAERRRAQARYGSYVYGNTAHKIEHVHTPARPRPERKTYEEKRRTEPVYNPAVNHRIRRNQEKALYMDLPYVIMLTVAAICALYICANYIQIQSSITARIHNIQILESEIETLKSENDALETMINTSIDLDHVYQVATEELGMVYANKEQVILYDKTESEYVRQYEDIPE